MFSVQADPDLPCKLVGDDVRVSQVIVNLLTNAVKYTDSGVVSLEIRCQERSETSLMLAVAVRDTGIGIRKEDMKKLFDSFSRLDETRNRHIEGTGLGMAIVTKLLTLMGSKLEVESEYGRGSVFSFVIRQGIADPAPIGTDLERRSDPDNRTEKKYPQFPGARVLVTDDNDMNLKVARNLLKLFGITPDLAHSGAQTIEQMRKNTYDILFLDHMMPKMDGIETLELLQKENLIPPETAVIVLTANAVIGAKDKYLQAGFQDYLSKPIDLDQLCAKLTAFLKAAAPEPEVPSPDDEIMEFLPASELAAASALEIPDFCDALEAEGFSVRDGLHYCGDDLAFYREILLDYADSCETRITELNAALNSGDLKQYRTSVHALKSVSRTVGADDVAELAKMLEDAAKNEDAGTIAAHQDDLASMLRRRTDTVKKLLMQ
jgi:CheY-like chemotaxis protein/anti-sigma regulatory factor (Ser/Thr protein kinase)